MVFLELDDRLHVVCGQREGGRCSLLGIDLEQDNNNAQGGSMHQKWELDDDYEGQIEHVQAIKRNNGQVLAVLGGQVH